MPKPLDQRSCVPCRGGVPPMEAEAANQHVSQLNGWTLQDDARRMERRFTFKGFAPALAFVQQVSVLAEAEQHHPDICFGWGYATVSLQTKKIRGLHENDFIMAAKVDRVAAGL